MASEQRTADVFPLPQTRRTTQLFIQILLTTTLSFSLYAAPTAISKENQTTIYVPTYSPFPFSHTTMFMNIAAKAPSVVTVSVLASAVTPAERRQHVAWFAESHTDWGFRYSLGNASMDDGFDCSGFVRYVLNYFDIKSTRTAADQFKEGTRVPVELARAGDLVFFGGKNSVSHVAMVVSNNEKGLVVVHSTCTRGIVKENITESAYWKPKLKDKAVNIIGL